MKDLADNEPCVYVCVFVAGMYTCKSGYFGMEIYCLCLCCYRGYVRI